MKKLLTKKLRGEGHFLAVLIVIAVVVCVGVFYKAGTEAFMKNSMEEIQTTTSGIFDQIK